MAEGNKNSGNSIADEGDAKVEVELEAMRKDDFSWHPCKVSLSSSGVGLLVEYSDDNSDPDDIILNREEAVARLRIRSTPLEGLACSIIQRGDCVLAKRNHVNLFFDAEIIKVLRVRHSSRTHCRCTFMVNWIHNGLEGETAIIPSSDLMRMSTESIHVHPTIFAFFNTLSTSSCCDVSPLRAVAEGMYCEMDENELEKQIEEISNSADPSRMKITEEMLSEEVDVQERSKFNPIAASEVCDSYIQLPSFLDCLTGSAGQAQCNLPIKMEIKHPPPPSPFTQEVFSESWSPCNPIAACAVLASVMSKSSDATEILSADQDVKGHIPPANISDNAVAMKLSNGSTPQTISLTNDSAKTNEECCLATEVATATLFPKYESIVKELFPTKKPIKESQTLDAPSEAWKWESKNEKSSQEVASCVGNHVSSTRKKTMGLPTTTVKRTGENMETPLTNTRRFTRSVVREMKEKQSVETKNVKKEIQLTTSEQKLCVQERDLLADNETVASITDNRSGLANIFKNQMDKRGICENNVSAMRTNARGMQDLNNSRRFTRSAVNGRTKKNTDPHNGSEHTKLDREKANSSSPVHEICPNPNAEGYKKVQLSAFTKTAKKPEDGGTSSVTRSQGIKRKSITYKKQELRSSPRLGFLPRTRSQTKS